MSLHPIEVAGLRKVGEIARKSGIKIFQDQDALLVAKELMLSDIPGAPVVNGDGKFVGFISEVDILGALELGRDISQLTAQEIMVSEQIAIDPSTTIVEAVRIMKERHVMVLPLIRENDGVVTECVTRQDLLRAWVGFGVDPKEGLTKF